MNKSGFKQHSRLQSWIWAALLGVSVAANAQAPLPTPQPLSSPVRQRLRAAILEVASSRDPNVVNIRPALASPLARLGDWNGALRLLRYDMNAPANYNELWHWRACQLAHAGKWNAVAPAAAHIKHLPVRADALLFAARTAIDRGVMLHAPGEASRQLETLLLAASPLLEKGAGIQQKAYSGYLWARGGDPISARRVFERTLASAKVADDLTEKQSKKNVKDSSPMRFQSGRDNTRMVLAFEAHAGQFQMALRHVVQVSDSTQVRQQLLYPLVHMARTPADIKTVAGMFDKWPDLRRTDLLFSLSILNSAQGDREQGRFWFEQARQLAAANEEATSTKENAYRGSRFSSDRVSDALWAVYAAHFLQDVALKVQTTQKLRVLAKQLPATSRFMKVEEVEVLPAWLDLQGRQRLGLAGPLTPENMDRITAVLLAASPSDLQFQSLETVASYYFLEKRPRKLLPVAQRMFQTARILNAAEQFKRS